MRSQRKVSSSATTMPPRAVHSVAMLASVARSSIERLETPGPVNSITRLSVASGFANSSRMWSIRSLAVTFSRSLPTSSKRIDSGTSTWVKPAWTSAAYSVAPTPQVSALLAPPMQVWLSVACTKSPGETMRVRATSWQMPGETPSRAE